MTIFNSKLLVYQRVAPFHWQWIDHKVPKVPGQGSGRDAQGTIQGLLPFRSVSDPVFILDVKHLGVDHSSANVQVVEGSKNRDPHPISWISLKKHLADWRICQKQLWNVMNIFQRYKVLKIPFWNILGRFHSLIPKGIPWELLHQAYPPGESIAFVNLTCHGAEVTWRWWWEHSWTC